MPGKTYLRKRKTLKEIPYHQQWQKYIHLYGTKDKIPYNVKERVKKFVKGIIVDPLA